MIKKFEKDLEKTKEDKKVLEKIVKKRYAGGKLEYQVKWTNMSEKNNSWIQSDNPLYEDAIKKFEKNSLLSHFKPVTTRRTSTASNKTSEHNTKQEQTTTTSAPDDNYGSKDTEKILPEPNDQSNNDKNATGQADVERILDLIRWDEECVVKCLVKYKGNTKPKWVPLDEIKRNHPIPLINYYETRIVLRKKQYDLVFERTYQSPAQRKLVVIQ